MDKTDIEDFLSHAEGIVNENNGELSPPDLNTLRDIETSITDSVVTERINKIRERHTYWTEHYQEPDNIETSLS